jgi:hypothetical protein
MPLDGAHYNGRLKKNADYPNAIVKGTRHAILIPRALVTAEVSSFGVS